MRPTYGQLRIYDGVLDDTPHDVNWDSDKEGAGEGKLDLSQSIRPERPPERS